MKHFIVLALCILAAIVSFHCDEAVGGCIALAAFPGFSVGDKLLSQSQALPNGAANVTSSAIDLQHGTDGGFLVDGELVISAPSLTATQLPNTQTMIYDIVESANADLSSPTTIATALLTQTGDGSTVAAAEARFRPQSTVKRYVGVKATKSGTGDASGASVTLALKL